MEHVFLECLCCGEPRTESQRLCMAVGHCIECWECGLLIDLVRGRWAKIEHTNGGVAMTKILVSPGFGAGWSTWSEKPKEVAEYLPIIDYLEGGGDPKALETHKMGKKTSLHPLVEQMVDDLYLDSFYTGGGSQLEVQEVDGPYRINEYDGSESVETEIDFW